MAQGLLGRFGDKGLALDEAMWAKLVNVRFRVGGHFELCKLRLRNWLIGRSTRNFFQSLFVCHYGHRYVGAWHGKRLRPQMT